MKTSQRPDEVQVNEVQVRSTESELSDTKSKNKEGRRLEMVGETPGFIILENLLDGLIAPQVRRDMLLPLSFNHFHTFHLSNIR